MKKILISTIAVLGLLASCDPATDDISAPKGNITAEQLAAGFVTVQYADADHTTPQEDGNYFTFTTSPACSVSIYQVNEEDGSKTVLGYGTMGTFKLAPRRGSDTTQTVYVSTLNYDDTEVVITKEYTVYVAAELTTDMRYLVSDDYGSKVWKWDVINCGDAGTGAWGNLGYAGNSGDDLLSDWSSNMGIWWACAPADLTGQLQHSDTGIATGEEDIDATMVFDEDGTITCYDAKGNQIRSGHFSVSGYTGERNVPSADGELENWALGYLDTDAAGILFPFQINGNGTVADHFEILQLDAGHLKLIYPYAADSSVGMASWTEATWWAFKSNSDAIGSLTDFGTKTWTWDTDWQDGGGAWGNRGYYDGCTDDGGIAFANGSAGVWWACAPADLTGQLNHSDTGLATGEEDPDAYMTFDWKAGKVTSYDASGNEIRSAKYEINDWGNGEYTVPTVDGEVKNWAMGYLDTDAAGILFPFQINACNYSSDGKGVAVTHYEIMQLDSDHMKLIYPYPADPDADVAGWSEATWWAFKAK